MPDLSLFFSFSSPKDPDAHVEPTVPLLTAEQFAALRDSLVGEYEPAGCVPSADCCCAVGRTKVTANETSPMLMNVDTKLKGEGFSCLQKDGQRRIRNDRVTAAMGWLAETAQCRHWSVISVRLTACFFLLLLHLRRHPHDVHPSERDGGGGAAVRSRQRQVHGRDAQRHGQKRNTGWTARGGMGRGGEKGSGPASRSRVGCPTLVRSWARWLTGQ